MSSKNELGQVYQKLKQVACSPGALIAKLSERSMREMKATESVRSMSERGIADQVCLHVLSALENSCNGSMRVINNELTLSKNSKEVIDNAIKEVRSGIIELRGHMNPENPIFKRSKGWVEALGSEEFALMRIPKDIIDKVTSQMKSKIIESTEGMEPESETFKQSRVCIEKLDNGGVFEYFKHNELNALDIISKLKRKYEPSKEHLRKLKKLKGLTERELNLERVRLNRLIHEVAEYIEAIESSKNLNELINSLGSAISSTAISAISESDEPEAFEMLISAEFFWVPQVRYEAFIAKVYADLSIRQAKNIIPESEKEKNHLNNFSKEAQYLSENVMQQIINSGKSAAEFHFDPLVHNRFFESSDPSAAILETQDRFLRKSIACIHRLTQELPSCFLSVSKTQSAKVEAELYELCFKSLSNIAKSSDKMTFNEFQSIQDSLNEAKELANQIHEKTSEIEKGEQGCTSDESQNKMINVELLAQLGRVISGHITIVAFLITMDVKMLINMIEGLMQSSLRNLTARAACDRGRDPMGQAMTNLEECLLQLVNLMIESIHAFKEPSELMDNPQQYIDMVKKVETGNAGMTMNPIRMPD